MNDVVIRAAEPSEIRATALLRWEWILENGGHQAGTREEFVDFFVEWAAEHQATHRCTVAVLGGRVIGMAWLATVPRVPSPRSFNRTSGDVQCVFVVPEHRNAGIGQAILAAVRELAGELGMERITVHSSPRAVTAYGRAGFEASPKLLQLEVTPVGGAEARTPATARIRRSQ